MSFKHREKDANKYGGKLKRRIISPRLVALLVSGLMGEGGGGH